MGVHIWYIIFDDNLGLDARHVIIGGNIYSARRGPADCGLGLFECNFSRLDRIWRSDGDENPSRNWLRVEVALIRHSLAGRVRYER